jgi:hypothetical protein
MFAFVVKRDFGRSGLKLQVHFPILAGGDFWKVLVFTIGCAHSIAHSFRWTLTWLSGQPGSASRRLQKKDE